jgi:hypothetical protein
MAPGVIDVPDWLQTLQSRVFAVVASGQSCTTKPPFAPHPFTAVGFAANAVAKVDVAPTPVKVTVAVVVQVFAEIDVVGRVSCVRAAAGHVNVATVPLNEKQVPLKVKVPAVPLIEITPCPTAQLAGMVKLSTADAPLPELTTLGYDSGGPE